MVVRNFADVIVALAVLALPFITGYVAKAMGKSSSLSGLIGVLPMVAKDAVVVAEKTGVLDSLTGNEQFAKALATAKAELAKLGYDKIDEQVLVNALEQAYAQLKSAGTLAVYKNPVEPKVDTLEQAHAQYMSAGDLVVDNKPAEPKPEVEAQPEVESQPKPEAEAESKVDSPAK